MDGNKFFLHIRFYFVVQGSCLAMKMLVSLSGHFSRHFAQKNSLRFCEIKTIPVGWMILVKKSLLHPKSQCVCSFVVITVLLFHEISSVRMKLNSILQNEWKKISRYCSTEMKHIFSKLFQNSVLKLKFEYEKKKGKQIEPHIFEQFVYIVQCVKKSWVLIWVNWWKN